VWGGKESVKFLVCGIEKGKRERERERGAGKEIEPA
jgi:hypothetical protein